MERTATLIVSETEASLRLDEYVRLHSPNFPIAAIRRAIEEGDILVNGHRRSSGWRIRRGDKVDIQLTDHLHLGLVPEEIALDVLYEDEHLLAINKPPGLLSHPSPRERTGTLINALLWRFAHNPADRLCRPILVHRLDRETSGVILVAKNERAIEQLAKQFNSRQVRKLYRALVFGSPDPASGQIDAPIGKHPVLWPKWRVMEKNSRPALTLYRVVEQYEQTSLVELELMTGRTHQIRIHLAHIGHPIVGDHTYGRAENKLWQQTVGTKTARHLLHSYSLELRHPFQDRTIYLTAPLPTDMLEWLKIVRTVC